MADPFSITYNKNAALIHATYSNVNDTLAARMNAIKKADLNDEQTSGGGKTTQSNDAKLMWKQLMQMLNQYVAKTSGTTGEAFMAALAAGSLPPSAVGGLSSGQQEELSTMMSSAGLSFGSMV